MTYAIKFVNFTLAAPFQKNLGRWRGCARSTRSMVPMPMGFTTDTNVSPSIFGFTNFTSYPCDFANGCIEWLKCS